jgi:uncharacterized protein DUF2795
MSHPPDDPTPGRARQAGATTAPPGRSAGRHGTEEKAMTRGLGGHSPANVTHHLKGIHFPAKKQDLIKQAKHNGAEKDIMDVLNGMEEQEFASIAEVMKAVGEVERDMPN